MKLTLNGEARDLEACGTVSDLLASLQLTEKMVLVELNGQAVHRVDFSTANLVDGDTLEIVRMVGGG
jgi:sulfur carrier protein